MTGDRIWAGGGFLAPRLGEVGASCSIEATGVATLLVYVAGWPGERRGLRGGGRCNFTRFRTHTIR